MTTVDIDEVRMWAVEAGEIARHYFKHAKARRKADRSFVTEADEIIERQLASRIAARYPDHGILGEEQTQEHIDREFVWVVDPIDGTASFVAGLGSWCISIGLLRNGEPYLGVIYLPLLDDSYYAWLGGGAFLNGEPIQVHAPQVWETETWLATPATLHHRYTLDFIGKTRVLGSTAAQMCYVARGSALGALLAETRPWDVAAGLIIVSEAGGVVTPLDSSVPVTGNAINGSWLAEPLLVAHASQIEPLRRAFMRR